MHEWDVIMTCLPPSTYRYTCTLTPPHVSTMCTKCVIRRHEIMWDSIKKKEGIAEGDEYHNMSTKAWKGKDNDQRPKRVLRLVNTQKEYWRCVILTHSEDAEHIYWAINHNYCGVSNTSPNFHRILLGASSLSPSIFIFVPSTLLTTPTPLLCTLLPLLVMFHHPWRPCEERGPSLVVYIGRTQGSIPQMSSAYSRIVLSLLNFPEPAVFKMDIRVHRSRSTYARSTSACAARYWGKSFARR